jgi:hypothetical protein
MPRDILSEYGRDSGVGQKRGASNGGQMPVRDVMGYKPPVGPTDINDPQRPGLGGHNCGNAGTQGAKSISTDGHYGSPGIHGKVHPCGSQR